MLSLLAAAKKAVIPAEYVYILNNQYLFILPHF